MQVRISRGYDARVPLYGADPAVLGKISGPLLDRIDLHIEVPAVAYKEMRSKGDGVGSAEMRQRVEACRAIQHRRGFYNAHIPHQSVAKALRSG